MKKLGMARSAFAASAVAVALALAGCGGGGDADDRVAQADAKVKGLNDQIEALEGQVKTLTGERDTARGEVSDLEALIGMIDDLADDAPSASLYAQLNAAKADAAGLRTHIGMMDDLANMGGSLYAQINYHIEQADTLRMQAGNMGDDPSATGSLHAQIAYHMGEAARIQGLLNTASGNLSTANGRITTLETMIGDAGDKADASGSLHAQLNHYKAEARRLQGEIDTAANARLVAKAKAVNMAIREAASITAPAAPSVTVKASSAGTLTVTTSTAGYADAGAAPDPEGLPSGWRGKRLTEAGGDTLVVYTDIEDSSGVTLLSRYSATTMNRITRFPIADPDDSGSIPWSAARRSDNGVFTSSQTVNGVLDRRRTFRGTVLDAPGTFTCSESAANSNDCKDPMAHATTGVLTPLDQSAPWSFVPDAGALAQVSDTAYIALGWWLNKVDSETYTFRRIAMAGGADLPAFEEDNGDAVTGDQISGTAKYTGGAAGKYSFLNEVLNEAEAGHWTATANLTANFDADYTGVAVTDPVTENTNDMAGVSVSGTITNFVTDQGAEAGWMVTLAASDGREDQVGTAETLGMQGYVNANPVDKAGATTWSRGSDAAAKGEGTWSYAFHGDPNTNTTPNPNVSSQPSAITGMFDAKIGEAAYLTGAFGAQKVEDE